MGSEFGGPPASRPTVLLLHGFPESPAMWRDCQSALESAGCRVVVPPLRGYEFEARDDRYGFGVQELVDDIRVAIDESGAEQVHLVGHDWGGLLAWAVASLVPDRVLSVTALSAAHPRAMTSPAVLLRQLPRAWYMALLMLPLMPEWLLSRRQGALLRTTLVRSGLSTECADGYADYLLSERWRLPGALSWYRGLLSWRSVLRCTPPTMRALLVYGDCDPFMDESMARATTALLGAQCEVECIKGAGHWLLEESGDETVAAVVRFLGSASLAR